MSGYEISARDKSCPACAAVAKVDAVLCIKCGLNFQTSMRTQEAARDPADAHRRPSAHTAKPAHRCKCGYDLTGLAGRPCPECGKTAEGRKKGGKFGTREERRAENIAEYWRASWLVLIVGSIVGLALTFGVGIGLRNYDALLCLMYLGITEASVFIGCFALCLTFLGFEEDVRGLVMRLTAVGAVWCGLLMLITMIPAFGVMMTVGIAVMSVFSLAVTLHVLTGREYTDSSIIAVASWVLCFTAVIVVNLMLAP